MKDISGIRVQLALERALRVRDHRDEDLAKVNKHKEALALERNPDALQALIYKHQFASWCLEASQTRLNAMQDILSILGVEWPVNPAQAQALPISSASQPQVHMAKGNA